MTWGGLAPSEYFSSTGQVLASIGIDPDLPISDAVGDRLTSGALRPSAYAKFSSTAVTANPYSLITNPKDSLVYCVLANGRLLSYTSAFASETLVGTVASPNTSATYGVYYNNYIYIRTQTNISRYGPLNNTPTLVDSVWTGATLGSQTALTNYTLPSIRGGGTLPFTMFVHSDNNLYHADFINGKGLIHKIQTTKTTNEGDTNNGSAYNVLDLPFGFIPTCIGNYGADLVIGGIQTTNGTITQGKAMLFFWDTFSDSFYNQVPLADTVVTALINNNGFLHVFSGSIGTGADVSNGYRVSAYLGGQTLKQIYFSNTGSPPLLGAVDSIGEKVIWGTFEQIATTTASAPEYYATVMSINSKDARLSSGVQGIAKASATATAADGLVTAVKNLEQSSFSFPKYVIGWRDATSFGIDSKTTTYTTSIWRSPMIQVGQKFVVNRISLPLAVAVASNITVTPKIFLDDFSSSSTTYLQAITATNFPNSERNIVYYPTINGNHNFCFELRWSGSVLAPILFPITIELDVYDN